jgi:hypothetical protein
MKVFRETVGEAANRLSEGTFFGCLFFAHVGIFMVVTQHFYMSGEYWGKYLVEKGPIVVIGVGVSLTAWSFLTLWICYFRRVRRILPYMAARINCFLLLMGFCLTVPVLTHLIYGTREISLGSLIVLLMSAHFFHKRVKSAVETVEKVPEEIFGRDAENSNLTECATINDLMFGNGKLTPENCL